jgi:hypothetical protein
VDVESAEPLETVEPPPAEVALSSGPATASQREPGPDGGGDGGAGPPEVAGRGSRRAAPPVLWVVVVALAVVALVTSLLAADAVADRNRERRDRQAVEEVAGRLATALSTYDYRDFEATKKRVLSLSTGAFALEYERAVAALASLIDQTKATSEATAGDVFVGNLADGKASAIVVIEIRATGVGGPRVSVDNYVDLSLVKVEGQWKVDGVRNLNLGVSGGGTATPPASRPATPETTAATTTASTAKPAP